MKYANIICNGLAVGKERRVINLGDAFEIIAIDKIYEKMGIPEKDIVEIDLYEIDRYDGEEVVLPINFMFVPKIMGTDLLNISSKIIPIFLGVTITEISLTADQIAFLKKWEPIGCREERTKNTLSSLGIRAYLGGCIVTTLSSRGESENNCKDQVAFIDVPKFVEPYVPEEIRKKTVFLDHEFFVSYDKVCEDPSLKRTAKARIQYYAENISLIVTSRFHGAVIGLALGIPVILVAENNFYKFSWLSKLLPFYDNKSVDKIDWHPISIDMAEIKKEMMDIAIARIQNAYMINYVTEKLQEKLSNEERDDSESLRYISSVIHYIKENWEKAEKIEYAIWGINENAVALHKYITEQYPNAVLVKIFDGLQERRLAGLTSCVPTLENIDMDTFVFVTSNTACKPAEELFKEKGKRNYFLCSLDFMSENI